MLFIFIFEGRLLKIVNGTHRGETAKMLSLDEKTFSVAVKLESVSEFYYICHLTAQKHLQEYCHIAHSSYPKILRQYFLSNAILTRLKGTVLCEEGKIAF